MCSTFSSHRQSSTGSVVVTTTCATSPLSQIKTAGQISSTDYSRTRLSWQLSVSWTHCLTHMRAQESRRLGLALLKEFKCLLNYLWCCAADGTTALAREYRRMPEAPPFAFDRVQAGKSMMVPFSVPSAPMPLPRSLRHRRRKTPGFPVPFDPECCYLYVDGSYEPAAGNAPEKCGWGLHFVRANVVQGAILWPHFLWFGS